jgi:hypothetical protein
VARISGRARLTPNEGRKGLASENPFVIQRVTVMRFVAVLAIVSSVLRSLSAQEVEGAFIGTTNREKHEQDLYAVALTIVNEVAKSDSDLVSRIFIFKVTKSDCCNPLSIGGDCFQCCDNPNHVVCGNNAAIGFILARIKKVSEAEWENARRLEFKNVTEWVPISAELDAHPIREVKPESPEAKKFWGQVNQ